MCNVSDTTTVLGPILDFCFTSLLF